MLIAAAVDFSGQGWDSGARDRMAATLALGLGGRVSAGSEHGALLFHRPPPHVAAHPVRAPNGDAMLFAGQIHDRAGLRKRLGVEPGRPIRDAELYARAHAALGEDCDRIVIGCYAAIALRSAAQELRAVRSPLNPPPLYWWRERSRLIVASTPRVMFAAGNRAEIDWIHFDNCQLLNARDLSRSWYRGISRVEPGQSIRWTPSGEHRHRFWSAHDLPRVNLPHDGDYPEAARELMLRATREMLADFRRPGIMLSGGLDSQAVAAFMLDVLPSGQNLPSYTRVPEPGFTGEDSDRQIFDESGHVCALAGMHPRLSPQFIHPGGQDFGKVLQETFLLGSAASMAAANVPWMDAICVKAAQDGCDVLLNGQNGNAGFSYKAQPAIAEWTRQGRWLRAFRELRHFRDDRSQLRRMLYYAILPNFPRSIQRSVALRAGSGRRQPFEAWSGMRADYAARTGAVERSLGNGFDPQFLPMSSSVEERVLMFDSGAGDATDIWLALQLKSGLQFRDPTAYRPLVEFCFGIPAEQFLRGGADRRLARRMLEGRVPEAVRQETRVGFQCADWPLSFARMRGELLKDLRRMAANPEIARRIDCERLIRDLERWDGDASRETAERILLAVSRAVTAGRFVDYVEGCNL